MEQFKILKRKFEQAAFFKSAFYLKYNQLIIPGVVLVFAMLILFLVTIPQFLKLFETFKTIDDIKQKKAFYQTKIAELEKINLPETRQNLETALVALPVDRDIPGVTGELLVALSSSGMSLTGITFSSGGPESEQVQEYSLKMDVSGTEENLNNFLERVNLSPRIIRLNSIDVSRNGRSNTLSASLGFVTLYQMLPANIGSVDEAVPQISQADQQLLADIQTKVRVLPTEASGSGARVPAGKANPFSP